MPMTVLTPSSLFIVLSIWRASWRYVVGAGLAGQLAYDDYVRLGDGEDEVPLPVGEEVLHDLERGDVAVLHLADEVDHAGHVGHEVQLLGADVHVAGQDVVGDDVLYKGGLVVLLLVVDPRLAHGDGGEDADAARGLVVAGDEHGVVEAGADAPSSL